MARKVRSICKRSCRQERISSEKEKKEKRRGKHQQQLAKEGTNDIMSEIDDDDINDFELEEKNCQPFAIATPKTPRSSDGSRLEMAIAGT